MGRPRKIPEGEAINRALLVFWTHGYDRASVADLSTALGVGPSSLYNAFGSKALLYRRAIEHYIATQTDFVSKVEEAKLDVEPAVRGLLRGAAEVYAATDSPPGCAVMQSGGAANADESVAATITLEVKAALEKRVKRMLDRASKTHGTPLAASSRVLAKYVMATMRGLSQLAVDGASFADLLRVCNVAASACTARR